MDSIPTPVPANCPCRPAVRPGRAATTRSNAFTVVELLVVLLIMGIMAATATPTFFRTLRNQRLEMASRRLKVDLEQLRQTARVKSVSETITFSGSTYTLSTDVKSLDRNGQTYSVNFTKSPYKLTSAVASLSGGATSVIFNGYGLPNRGGTITLTVGTAQKVVTLDAASGTVTIQ